MAATGKTPFPPAAAERFMASHVRRAVEGVVQGKIRERVGVGGRQKAEHVQRAVAGGMQAKAEVGVRGGRPVEGHVQAAIAGASQSKVPGALGTGRPGAAHVQEAEVAPWAEGSGRLSRCSGGLLRLRTAPPPLQTCQAKATFLTVQLVTQSGAEGSDSGGWTVVESKATKQQIKAVKNFAVKKEEKQKSKLESQVRMTCEWNYKSDMNLGARWARAWEEVASFQMGEVRKVIQRRARDLYNFLKQQSATINPREGKAYTRDAFQCAEPKALASFLASIGDNEEWLLSSFRIKNIFFGAHRTPPCAVCSTWLEEDPNREGTYRIKYSLLGL